MTKQEIKSVIPAKMWDSIYDESFFTVEFLATELQRRARGIAKCDDQTGLERRFVQVVRELFGL